MTTPLRALSAAICLFGTACDTYGQVDASPQIERPTADEGSTSGSSSSGEVDGGTSSSETSHEAGTSTTSGAGGADFTTSGDLPEMGTTWPAASMDGGGGGDEPDTTSTTGGEPTCTAASCPVAELHGCTGDCDPCDTWAISWVPVPDTLVYLVRYSFAVPAPNEGDDIYGVADGAFRVTAPPGEPSTFPWAEEDGRLVVTCDRLTSGCPATYALLKVEVVGCVGDPQYPALAATCGAGVLLDGVEFPTGTCDPDPDTSSTGG